jgi:hypothetical protein
MHEGQERDYRYLMAQGATWDQAMLWCANHPLGYSGPSELDRWRSWLGSTGGKRCPSCGDDPIGFCGDYRHG